VTYLKLGKCKDAAFNPLSLLAGLLPVYIDVLSADKERQPLPVSGDAERPLPNARRDVPGRSEG
jgi:hypothetical protein